MPKQVGGSAAYICLQRPSPSLVLHSALAAGLSLCLSITHSAAGNSLCLFSLSQINGAHSNTFFTFSLQQLSSVCAVSLSLSTTFNFAVFTLYSDFNLPNLILNKKETQLFGLESIYSQQKQCIFATNRHVQKLLFTLAGVLACRTRTDLTQQIGGFIYKIRVAQSGLQLKGITFMHNGRLDKKADTNIIRLAQEA